MGRILTPAQAAKITGLGVAKIRALCERGVFGVNTSMGARPTWKIREEDLADYLKPDSKRDERPARASRIDADVAKTF